MVGKDSDFQSHANLIIKTVSQKLAGLSKSHRVFLISTKKVRYKCFIKDSLFIVPYPECLVLEL